MTKSAEIYFRHRSTVLLVMVAPLVALTLTPLPLNPIWVGVGVAVALGGAALRLASMRCIGRGARVHRADVRGALVTWGPYGVSRNPLYVAAALILTGLALVSGAGPWGLLVFPGALLIYTPVVLHEEVAIAAAVGEEFSDYKAKVHRWLGRPGGAPGPAERVSWAEVFKREKWLVPGVVLAVLGIGLIRAEVFPLRSLLERVSAPSHLPPALVGLVALGVGALGNSWVIQRKRRRRLQRERLKAEVATPEPVEVRA